MTTTIRETALEYLNRVFGYDDPRDVDAGTERDLRENAAEGYEKDAAIVRMVDAARK